VKHPTERPGASGRPGGHFLPEASEIYTTVKSSIMSFVPSALKMNLSLPAGHPAGNRGVEGEISVTMEHRAYGVLVLLLAVTLGAGVLRWRSAGRVPSLDVAAPKEAPRATTPAPPSAPGPELTPVDDLMLLEDPVAPDTGDPRPAGTDRERDPSRAGLPSTRLPFRLIGTVTGAAGYRSAVLEHTDNHTIRSVPAGQTWGSLRVRRVEEERVYLQNIRRNRPEILRLHRAAEASSRTSSGRDEGPMQQKRARWKKNREAMQKLQQILKKKRRR